MTTRHRIRADQLRVGAPLPVDIYDGNNRLLLRRGNVIATEHQLERLIDEGLYADRPLPAAPRGPNHTAAHAHDAAEDDPLVDGVLPRGEATKPAQRVSIYQEVAVAAKALETLFCAPEANPTFAADVTQLAQVLLRACRLDPDAALAHIMFAREERYPVRHCVNVAIITALLLERMKADPARAESAVAAALTMNIAIQQLQEVLYRQPKLTDAQRQEIHVHPGRSAAMLGTCGVRDPLWLALVEQHHENVDGSGYPNKLAGDAVEKEARVIGLADRYCGAVTERAYREAVAPDAAINHLRSRGGTGIEPALIDELVHWVGMYPPGTVVELFNRDVAVVAHRLRDPRHPVVFAIAGQSLRPFEWPRKRLTASQPQYHIERVLPREKITFPVDPETLWPRTVTDGDASP